MFAKGVDFNGARLVLSWCCTVTFCGAWMRLLWCFVCAFVGLFGKSAVYFCRKLLILNVKYHQDFATPPPPLHGSPSDGLVVMPKIVSKKFFFIVFGIDSTEMCKLYHCGEMLVFSFIF
jgi:hypothetical protein